MRIYDVNQADGTVINPAGRDAPADPMRGTPRVPAGATDIEPPVTGEHEAACWSGDCWELVPDYRGHVYYTDDGERHEITELGTEPPADALDEAPPAPLADFAANKKREIESALATALAAGMPYTMPDGADDVIQTRPDQDEANLLGLAIEARDLRDSGETEAVQELRTQSNAVYSLTPQQMIDATDSAKAFKKAQLKKSWQLKAEIAAALEADDRDALDGITW